MLLEQRYGGYHIPPPQHLKSRGGGFGSNTSLLEVLLSQKKTDGDIFYHEMEVTREFLTEKNLGLENQLRWFSTRINHTRLFPDCCCESKKIGVQSKERKKSGSPIGPRKKEIGRPQIRAEGEGDFLLSSNYGEGGPGYPPPLSSNFRSHLAC